MKTQEELELEIEKLMKFSRILDAEFHIQLDMIYDEIDPKTGLKVEGSCLVEINKNSAIATLYRPKNEDTKVIQLKELPTSEIARFLNINNNFIKYKNIRSAQACAYLGISKSTLYRWHKEGILVPHFINKHTKYRYYTKNQLDKFQGK